jgi:membrane associated rhomboid family serine protease
MAAARISDGSSAHVNFLPEWPRWAFIDALTRAERGAPRQTAGAVLDAELPQGATAFFYISFKGTTNRATWTPPKTNYGWSGGGDVVIDSRSMKITANRRRPFLFPKKVQREIPLDNVTNVEHLGEVVRFEVIEPDETPQRLVFQTVSAADADAIAQKLPITKTKDFFPILGEQAAFSKALLEIPPKAPVTPALILANVLMFAIATALGAGISKVNPEVLIRLGTDYTPLTLGGQWWRLLASTYLHFGLLHVAFNMWALYVNGMGAERIFGSVRYLVIYLVAGLCDSVASLLWHPVVNGAGASGAIFGVLGALIAYFVKKEGGVPPSVLKGQLNTATIFVLYSLLNGTGHQSIDNAAHLGGLAGGFIMGFVLSRPLQADRNSKQWTMQWAAAAAAVCLGTVSVADIIEKSRPIVRSLGGLNLGMKGDELIRAKGQPIHRESNYWVYNSVDSSHNGVLTAAFSTGSTSNDAVIAIEYAGDQVSAPADLPYLDGMSKDAVVKKFAPMTSWRTNFDGTVSIWFQNGVYGDTRKAVAFQYGIYDIAATGN